MNNFEFGLTMMAVGMGGTLAVLALFAVLMEVLKRIAPEQKEKESQ